MDSFYSALQALAEAQQHAQLACEAALQRSVASLFVAAPEIDYIFWHQYTPHFNDGEGCVFSVDTPRFVLCTDADADAEGSVLYSEADERNAEQHLADAQRYAADPDGWVSAYILQRGLHQRAGYNSRWVRPAYSVESAQQYLQIIQQQRSVITADSVARIQTQFDNFVKFFHQIPDDILKLLYGDHVRVCISRKGVQVESYE